MLFDPSNHDLIQALAYWLRGTGVRYQFTFDESDKITGLLIFDEFQNVKEAFAPGEWVSVT